MAGDQSEPLAPEAGLALAHTPLAVRDALRIFLELDARLARIVGATSEPMLGQMRLAWWRDTISGDPASWPRGDAVLDGAASHWHQAPGALVALVNGWEHMLADDLDASAVARFAAGRAAPFAALARMGGAQSDENAALAAARRWALVDAALHVSGEDDRRTLLDAALRENVHSRLPRPLRGLAVLDALARRSLARGGRPMMEGRGAALTATRAAIFGR